MKRFGGRQASIAPKARLVAAPDEILTRAPLLQAFDQMRPGDAAEEGPWLGNAYHSPCPLPTKTPGHGETDFTGVRVDRLTVIGRVDETATSFGGRWLVRCDCGIYETRRAKGLSGKMRTDRASCQRCDYLVHIRRREYFDRHGRWPEDQPAFELRELKPQLPHLVEDKGNRSRGDRAGQRRRYKARKRAERMERLKLMPAGRRR